MTIVYLILFNLLCLFVMLLMARRIDEQRKIIHKYEHQDKFPQTKWFKEYLEKQFSNN